MPLFPHDIKENSLKFAIHGRLDDAVFFSLFYFGINVLFFLLSSVFFFLLLPFSAFAFLDNKSDSEFKLSLLVLNSNKTVGQSTIFGFFLEICKRKQNAFISSRK